MCRAMRAVCARHACPMCRRRACPMCRVMRAPCAAPCERPVPRHASALCRAVRAPCATPCVRPVPSRAHRNMVPASVRLARADRRNDTMRAGWRAQRARKARVTERAKRASWSAPSQRYEALAKARAVRWLARKLLVSGERVRRRGKSSRCARELVRRDLPSRSPQLVCSSTPVREQPCYALWRSR